MCKRSTTTLGQLPKPLFRQCETYGSGSEEGKTSQPRIPHERRARRSGAFSRGPTLRLDRSHSAETCSLSATRGDPVGGPLRVRSVVVSSVEPRWTRRVLAARRPDRPHRDVTRSVTHRGGPAVNLVSGVEHGCPRLVSRRSMRVMRTNTHCAIGMVVAFAATARVHRESGKSRFGIILRRTRCVSDCSLVFCP